MSEVSYPKMYLYKRIVQAKLFIDSHFAEYINIDNIASEACFSKYHFIRLFKKAYGKTPHNYLTFVRIEKAKSYLREGLSVKDSCYMVSFDSLSSFTHLFRRETGVKPSDYRLNQLKIRSESKRKPLKYIPGCFAEKNGLLKKAILNK